MQIDPSPPLHIYLVQNDEYDRAAFHQAFQKANRDDTITDCSNAEEAIKVLCSDASAFDILVLDSKSLEVNAREFYRKLIKASAQLPIVLLAAAGSEKLAAETLREGVDDYIIKDSHQGYLELLPIVIPNAVERRQNRINHQQAREGLKRAHEELERCVAERTAALKAINAQLKREMETHKQAEKRYRLLAENLTDVIWTMDMNMNFTYFSPSVERLLGYTVEEAMRLSLADIMPPSSLKKAQVMFARKLGLRAGDIIPPADKPLSLELEQIRKDGSMVYTEVQMKILSATDDKPSGLIGAARDITERKNTEKALRESETQYRMLLNNIPNIVYKGYKDGSVEFFNRKIETLTGYDLDDFNSQKIKWPDIILKEDVESATQTFIRALKTNKSYVREYRIRSNTGDIRWLQDRGCIVCDDAGEIVYISGIFIDITQTKILQEQLLQSERFAATGQLAASVAHEINSPLQGIAAYLYSIEQTHQNNPELMEDLGLIKDGFERIRATVKNLLDFNRPGAAQKQMFNVNRIITTTTSLLKSYLKKQRIKIHLNLSSEIPEIYGHPQHLGQVFLNLINNGMESIVSGSPTETDPIERLACPGEITLASQLAHDKIVITVSDTGPGIDESDVIHLFDPFFTKKKARGMGIGLSVCRDIINNHKGSIAAANAPDGGAFFTITLPAG